MKLNPAQEAVVASTSTSIACIAGAGSGKTSTLVARIKKLISDGVRPSDVVAITYTNAAAKELLHRLDGVRLGYCGTLHGFVLRELAKNSSLVGLPSQLSVVDDDGKTALVEQIMAEMRVKEPLERVLDCVAREELARPLPEGARPSKLELVAVEYHRRLRRNGVLDFDSVLWAGAALAKALKENGVASSRHLFVDEVQDCADVDCDIYLTMPFASRFFVGDSDQSIFGFRGGNVRNFLRLLDDPKWQVHVLATNYRSASKICVMAQHVVEHNSLRYPKATLATKPGGRVEEWACKVSGEELVRAMGLAIERRGSLAILCRTNALADQFTRTLVGAGVEVNKRAVPQVPKDWRAVKLYVALLECPQNDFLAHQYLAAKFDGVHADRCRRKAALAGLSINDDLLRLEAWTPGMFVPQVDLVGFSHEAVMLVTQALERVNEVEPKPSLKDVLLELNRMTDHREETGDGVTVTTMHASKGREFDTVLVAGCEEEAHFGKTGPESDSVEEEERRLFYVAMTRARDNLFLSWSAQRPQNRGANVKPGPLEPRTRSRFLAEAGL